MVNLKCGFCPLPFRSAHEIITAIYLNDEKIQISVFVKCIYISIRLEIKKIMFTAQRHINVWVGGHDTGDKIDKIKVVVV